MNTARDLRAPATHADYFFLRRAVGQYDVMMAEPPTTWIAPSFGGKLVAAQNPLPFVAESDQMARRADVKTFFNAATNQLERRALLRKYRVSFVLTPRSVGADSAKVQESMLRALGSVVHADDRFLLVRLDSSVRR